MPKKKVKTRKNESKEVLEEDGLKEVLEVNKETVEKYAKDYDPKRMETPEWKKKFEENEATYKSNMAAYNKMKESRKKNPPPATVITIKVSGEAIVKEQERNQA